MLKRKDKSYLVGFDDQFLNSSDSYSTKKQLTVVVGIITNSSSRLLLSYRPNTKPQGGFWEFPGGKMLAEETPLIALKREMKEELNIQIINAKPFIKVYYGYEKQEVLLDSWFITQYCGTLINNEGQLIQWMELNAINPLDFSKPNQLILQEVKKSIHGLKSE